MSVKDRNQLKLDAETFLPDNTTEEISAQDVRERIIDLADSLLTSEDDLEGILTQGTNTLTEPLILSGNSVSIDDGQFFYFKGDADTDGSVRIGMVGDELWTQRRISGVWENGVSINSI